MSGNDSKNVVEELPCQLTDEERSDKGVALAGLHQQQLEVEEKKKTAMSDFNARIKKIGGDIHYLSTVVNSGKEARNVKCRQDYDWPAGTKTLTRLDTGEQVREEVISDFERQQHMEFVERENGKVAEEAAKEEWPEEETAEVAGPEICGDCGSSGDEHSDGCPTLSEDIPEDGPAEEEVEDEPVSCGNCGAPEGNDHSKQCPRASEEVEIEDGPDDEPEGTEETEGEPVQDETGDESPEEFDEVPGGAALPDKESVEEEQPEPAEEEESCFGQFDPDDKTCQGCSQSADCFEETPESKADEAPVDEKSDDLPPRHKCAKCEEFFEEPKDNGDEDDTTSCPLCGSNNWM